MYNRGDKVLIVGKAVAYRRVDTFGIILRKGQEKSYYWVKTQNGETLVHESMLRSGDYA